MFDDPFTPWGEITAFGNPWHGYMQGGNLFRPDGAAMTLPAGIQNYPAPDGSARLIDIGAPPVATSAADQAMGMTWWNKALLTGSGFGSGTRTYNNVHGTSTGAILFRKNAWVYKCADGTVYVLWFSPDNKIRADKLSMPTGTIPANDTGGTACLDISGSIASSRTIGGTSYPLYSWLNFSPDGTKAALHFGYVLNSGYSQDTYQIFEFSVSGGNATAAPTVTLSRYRSLETGGGLYTVFNQDHTTVELQGPNDLLPGSQPSGTEIHRNTTIIFVDYAANGDTKEVSTKQEYSIEYVPYIDARGHSNVQRTTDVSLTIMVNGVSVMAVFHQTQYDPDNSTMLDNYDVNDPYPALGVVKVLNGNLAVVATESAINFSSSGIGSGAPSIFGIVGANGTVGDAKSAIAAGIQVSNVAVDPQTGAFVDGRTRYF